MPIATWMRAFFAARHKAAVVASGMVTELASSSAYNESSVGLSPAG
ncbi:MAG: hypothetical protein H6Q02_559, partial [Acidobacteria bacterium]|nr:hypothetical protein [Acidobacteriota bacterium]